METIYDVNYFIKKFSPIPEDEWTVCIQQNELGQRCAFGHCMPKSEKVKGYMYHGYGDTTKEGKVLGSMFFFYLKRHPPEVNNGYVNDYQQPTPKQRILAALYDIYEKTYGKKYGEPEQPKVIYKTVVIDSAVKELQTSLTEN